MLVKKTSSGRRGVSKGNGIKITEIHYIHIWNCQRMNKIKNVVENAIYNLGIIYKWYLW